MPNRLAGAHSPYLLQHADNPVDWYPWGEEAFAAAKDRDRPIFLSIGYSTCHWCHVMAHESFEDASIAAVLNRDFVPVKLDREERPDVDRVYMTFVQATTGAGGWPMSVWLTPDLKPFFGGTYFPPTARWGRPGFIDILTELARAWTEDRSKVVASAESIVERLKDATEAQQSQSSPSRAPVATRRAVDEAVTAFKQTFDGRHGGFGGAPKFPRPSELFFLLQAHALTEDAAAKEMALDTLRAMALGGIRDHVGGGFHRYAVDAEWRVPHFEKMLYDQAQLVLAYLDAEQLVGDGFHGAVAEDTLEYVRRDLTADDGAFFSAEDADSRDPHATDGAHAMREGAFYTWTAAEIDQLLGDDAQVVRRRFGIEAGGNAPTDPQGEFKGQNLLYVAQAIEDIAARTSQSAEDVIRALARARQALFEARERRPRPHRDDKVITAWNGLMIAAFARAARVLPDSPRRDGWRAAAVEAAEAVERRLWQAAARRLLRRARGDEAGVDAFCEDYAYLTWGLVELFQATGDARWLTWARTLVDIQTERFFDDGDGGWFSTTGDDPRVLLRLKEDYDGAEPAAASVTVQNLLALGHLTNAPDLVDRAQRTLKRYGPEVGKVVRVMPFMVANVARWNAASTEIVVTGEAGEALRESLLAAVARRYMPAAVVVPAAPSASAALAGVMPWVQAMLDRGDGPRAYVCQNFTCREPVSDPEALARALDDATAPRRLIL